MKVVLSIGHGRIHFMQSAFSLAQRGVMIRLIMGWLPKRSDSLFIRWCSKFTGVDIASEMRSRKITHPNIEVKQCRGAEFLMNGFFMACRFFHYSRTKAMVCGWRLFGFCSRKHLKDAEVLHVRSGAGQGGAIRCARKRKMKVLVDHSIAHPVFMERQLRGEYERHGVPFDMGISSPFWRLVIRDCLDADRVLVNSDFVRDTFIEAGFPKEKLCVVHTGTRSDFWGLREANMPGRAPRLLFTGSFGFRKGGEYILEALRILKERGKVVMHMDVVGGHKGAVKLIEAYRSFELPITFHEQVPQDDLKQYLQNADIYVFPSLAEGCACSGLEAMAAGLCVVATRESGLPITDGETGFLVSAKDARAIAERLEWLRTHPDEINRVGANAARLIATEYTWEKYAERVEKIYCELVG